MANAHAKITGEILFLLNGSGYLGYLPQSWVLATEVFTFPFLQFLLTANYEPFVIYMYVRLPNLEYTSSPKKNIYIGICLLVRSLFRLCEQTSINKLLRKLWVDKYDCSHLREKNWAFHHDPPYLMSVKKRDCCIIPTWKQLHSVVSNSLVSKKMRVNIYKKLKISSSLCFMDGRRRMCRIISTYGQSLTNYRGISLLFQASIVTEKNIYFFFLISLPSVPNSWVNMKFGIIKEYMKRAL